MKKVSLALLVAAAMSIATTSAFAATATPKPHITGAAGAAEGTATHEMSESAATQNSEATTTTKVTHKTVAKKAKKAKKKAKKK